MEYAYDAHGRIIEVVGYPNNERHTLKRFEYDGLGRLTKEVDPYGHAMDFSYVDGFVDRWGRKSQKKIATDSLGNTTEEIYDYTNNPASVCKQNSLGKVLSYSEFFYDAKGNKICQKSARNGAEAESYVLRKGYDPGNRLAEFYAAAGTSSEKSIQFAYDRYGGLTSYSDGDGCHSVLYEYSQAGRLFQVTCKNESQNSFYSLNYDGQGRLSQIRLPMRVELTYQWDTDGQLNAEKVAQGSNAYQVNYTYDREGCLSSITLPDGSKICYEYEGPFVKSIIRASKDGDKLYTHKVLSRDLMGNILEEILLGICGLRKQRFDEGGRRTEITTDFFRDAIPSKGNDPLGNVTKRNLSFDGEPLALDYTYDGLSQLLAEAGDVEHVYSYDAIGNRLTKDGSAYEINEGNELVATGEMTCTFDSRGNLETKTLDGETWSYRYNPFSQLTLVETPDGTTLSFVYDLGGRRLFKTVEKSGHKQIFRYFYLGEAELGCIDEQGNIVELRVPSNPQAPATSPPIAIEIKKEVYIPITDLQGNVACLVDPATRRIEESYRYSAFGEEEIFDSCDRNLQRSAIGNPWRYKSTRVDDDLGLLYLGSRYYDPSVGRWISPDPARDIDGPNLYVYCHNNPLSYVDYSGLASEANASPVDESYFYGEYEPHCFCERHRNCKRGGDISDNVSLHAGWNLGTVGRLPLGVFFHPRCQGALRMLSGVAEFGVGAGLTMGTSGVGGAFGFAIMGHGLDHILAGATTVIGGRYKETATSQILQKAGMSPSIAHLADDGTATVATIATAGLIQASRATMLPMPRTASIAPTIREVPAVANYRPYTKGNFRYNLKQHTRISPGKEMQAHHVFPQRYLRDFTERGINIHDPRYGVWWETGSHQANAYKYNADWARLFASNPEFTQSQALEYSQLMISKYGIPIN